MCLAGSSKEIIFPCENNGGDGKFVFHAPKSLPNFKDIKGGWPEPGGEYRAGAFCITPSAFHLPPSATVNIKVTFAPTVPGEYTETLSLACDNCSSSQLTLSGKSEKLSVGVSEVESCSASDKSKTLSQADFRPSTSTSVSSLNLDYTEDTESSLLQTSVGHRESVFGTTNPRVAVNRRVRVRNLSESQLPFQWAVYRPLVRGALGGGDADSGVDTSALRQSSHSPFAIEPPCGCFEPTETKVFVMSFDPLHPGNYLDVAHLVLSGVPQVAVDEERFLVLAKERESEEKERTVCSVSAVSMELSGQCEAYRVELSPPLIGNLGCLSVGVELKRTVKVVNYSQCNVQFEWDWSMSCAVGGTEPGQGVTVRVDPPRGTVVAGCVATCSVCMLPKRHGVCNINLLAKIKNVDKPLICPVTLDVKGPDLSIGVPSLDFNLVQVGKKSTLALPIRNDSCVPAQFAVSCMPQDTGDACLTNCIEMKVTGGELPPGGKTTLLVSFAPTAAGHLRALLRCSVEGSRSLFVAVTGEAQRPLVSLDACHHHPSGAFLNVPLEGTVILQNQSVLATHYTWSDKFIGEGAGLCNLTLSPCEGHIGPREEVSVEYEIVWTEKGHMPPVIATCFIDEMEHPLHLSLTADVVGISVHFDLLTADGNVISSSREDEEEEREETLSFDFGDSCALGSDHCLLLRVTNLSGIAAKVASHVVNFPAAVVQCSQTATGSTSKLSLSRRSLLPKTVNLGSSSSKADHQVERDLQKALLADGLGACFVVNPVDVDLLPFSSEIISIKAYSDMWGRYQDELIVKVEGMEERSFPISYCAVGCPIRFMNTCSSGSSSLRYGSHPVSTVPVKRSFKLQNTSPTDIRIDWETFCYLPESQDTQLVDLVVRIGEAFPVKDSVLRGEGSTGHARHSVSSTSLNPRVSAHRSWMAAKSGPLRSKWRTREKSPEESGEKDPERESGEKNLERESGEKDPERESEEKDPERESEEKDPERESGEKNLERESGEKDPERESGEKDPERESGEKDPERESGEKRLQRESREKKSDDDTEGEANLSASMSEDVISSPEDCGDTACCPAALSEPLIKCYITPHEGVHSSCPYTIKPPQLVLPAKSQSSITITFTPSLEALNVYGRHVGAYGIGFLSLDRPEESQYVSRASGDDVTPLRIDLVGCIEHPQLHLTSEDSETPNVLAVEVRADVLFDGDVTDCSTGMVEESYFLHNSNSSQLSFTLNASPPFSLTTVDPGTRQDTSNLSIVLLPKKTLQVKVLLPLSIGDLRDLLVHKSEDSDGSSVPNSVEVNSQLTVNYNTGAVQAWPLSCTIKLPRLSVPANAVSFAKCFVATRVSSILTLRNLGYSAAHWYAKLSNGHPSFSISSSKGKLDPHLTHGRDSIHALVVSYHPLVEEEAGDVLVITEAITGWSIAIPLIGSSSTDERHFVSYRQ